MDLYVVHALRMTRLEQSRINMRFVGCSIVSLTGNCNRTLFALGNRSKETFYFIKCSFSASLKSIQNNEKSIKSIEYDLQMYATHFRNNKQQMHTIVRNDND